MPTKTKPPKASTRQKRDEPEPQVSPMGFWLQNSFDKCFTIVDCGYVNHANARNNADRLLEALGATKRQGLMAIVGAGRVVIRIPKAKLDVLKRFSGIKKGVCYSWTTHVYDKGGPQFDLKYATS